MNHNCDEFPLPSCSNIFLRAGNNPVVLKNSTEHTEPLFISLLEIASLQEIMEVAI